MHRNREIKTALYCAVHLPFSPLGGVSIKCGLMVKGDMQKLQQCKNYTIRVSLLSLIVSSAWIIGYRRVNRLYATRLSHGDASPWTGIRLLLLTTHPWNLGIFLQHIKKRVDTVGIGIGNESPCTILPVTIWSAKNNKLFENTDESHNESFVPYLKLHLS